MIHRALAPLVAASLVLAACQTGGTKQTVGTFGGAAGGALLGSQIGHGTGTLVAVGLGTLLGAMVGGEIGRSMDETDRMATERATHQAFAGPVGEEIRWNNPENGHYGTVMTTREGTQSSGAYCREYQQTVVIGGRAEQAMGRACRNPDGSWRIVQ